MRKNRIVSEQNEFSILTLDDDEIMTLTIQSYFRSTGFHVDVENDPLEAIERIRNSHYDILLLDFLMRPICGDAVVSRIREFNKDIFIILLTGHRSLAPPVQTIRDLDIQGYYEKSDRFDQLELLVESCVKSIRQMRTIYRYRDGLGHILDTMPNLYAQQTTEGILIAILENAMQALEAENGFVYFDQAALNGDGRGGAVGERYYRGTGPYADGEAYAVARYLELVQSGANAGVARDVTQGGERLMARLYNERNAVFGIIGVDIVGEVEDENLQLFEIYAKHASSALNNALLDALVHQKNEELHKAYASLRDNYLEIIDTIRFMVDAKDIYTRGHSDRVSYYAALVAKRMGKDEAFVRRVELAGLFHDIGKIATSESILLKNTRLTSVEYEQVKQHPARGARILSALSAFEGIPRIIECHHERIDGTGYPSGLAGEGIPEESRIISVADAFDAMTTDRHYRKRLSLEKATEQLELGKNTQFDAGVVDAFIAMLDEYDQIQAAIAWTYTDDDKIKRKEVDE